MSGETAREMRCRFPVSYVWRRHGSSGSRKFRGRHKLGIAVGPDRRQRRSVESGYCVRRRWTDDAALQVRARREFEGRGISMILTNPCVLSPSPGTRLEIATLVTSPSTTSNSGIVCQWGAPRHLTCHFVALSLVAATPRPACAQ